MTDSEPNPFKSRYQHLPLLLAGQKYVFHGNFGQYSYPDNAEAVTSTDSRTKMLMEFARRGLGVIPEQSAKDSQGNDTDGLEFYRDDRLSYQDIFLLDHAEVLAFPTEPLDMAEIRLLVDKAIDEVGLASKLQELGFA